MWRSSLVPIRVEGATSILQEGRCDAAEISEREL